MSHATLSNQVLSHSPDEWKSAVFHMAVTFLKLRQFVTGEQIRLLCNEFNCGQPHHPNAWGAMIQNLHRSGLLKETDYSGITLDPRQHHTRLVIWESLLYKPRERNTAPSLSCETGSQK